MIADFPLLIIMILGLFGTPGPATISIVASAVSYGFRNSLSYVWGTIFGAFIVLSSSLIGVHYLIKLDDLIITFLKVISLAYMLYLVYKIWNSKSLEIKEGSSALSFKHGVLLNILNPKAYIATFAIYSQFINPTSGLEGELLIMFIILIILVIIGFGYCYLAETMFKLVSEKDMFKNINRTMAVLLLLSIAYLALISW